MLRSVINSCVSVRRLAQTQLNHAIVQHTVKPLVSQFKPMVSMSRCFSAVLSRDSSLGCGGASSHPYLNSMQKPNSISNIQSITPMILQQQSRTVIKFGLKNGKRRTVKAVLARFKRLDWGIWIRRMAGAHKKLWRKSDARKMRLERHVFCNATQSYMLDKMVTSYWRTPKYWVDDPYAPYHQREDFTSTRRKPRPLPPHVSFEQKM